MIGKTLLAIGLAILVLCGGTTSYIYLSTHQSRVVVPPQKPTAATPRAQAFTLPGTLYLAQSGAIYSLSIGRFHQLTPEDGWTQPALFPDGNHMLAVKQSAMYSDVYALTRFGNVSGQLTSNAAPARNPDPGANHWSFYPRLSSDGRTIWMTYDEPKYGYDVVMSVWALPYGGTMRQAKLWTVSNDYTGGDVQPLPLPTGGIIYTKYSYGPDLKLIGQLWFTNRAGAAGRALTTPAEDCGEPALSPSGTRLAMVCSYEKQVSNLVIVPWNGSSMGVRTTVISDQMVAQPIWAPDGSGIAYLAPGVAAGPFQLWWLPQAAYNPPVPSPVPTPTPTPGGPHNGPLPSPTPTVAPTPAPVKPIQVTSNLGFDATSPIAWAP